MMQPERDLVWSLWLHTAWALLHLTTLFRYVVFPEGGGFGHVLDLSLLS